VDWGERGGRNKSRGGAKQGMSQKKVFVACRE
jgi:hypothetical protein